MPRRPAVAPADKQHWPRCTVCGTRVLDLQTHWQIAHPPDPSWAAWDAARATWDETDAAGLTFDQSDSGLTALYFALRLQRRYDAKVDRSAGPNACWPWTGAGRSGGGGKISIRLRSGRHRLVEAHHLAYLFANGDSYAPALPATPV